MSKRAKDRLRWNKKKDLKKYFNRVKTFPATDDPGASSHPLMLRGRVEMSVLNELKSWNRYIKNATEC